jgi:NAD+ synthase
LTDTYESFKKTLNPYINDLSLANTRARLRMTTLYQVAGLYNGLVTGTGNKVEDFGVGFYTKYGDGGVDISPIADLMKSQVYKIGAAMGVSKEILTAPPTDGLWDDTRTDESQLGASYDELEWAMTFDGNTNECNNRETKVLEIYKSFNTQNKHKMVPIPVFNFN